MHLAAAHALAAPPPAGPREFNGYAVALWKEHGLNCEMAYHSERDDWILAVVASGLGIGSSRCSAASASERASTFTRHD